MLLPALRHDIVRAGIALYGLWPSDETRLLMISREQELSAILTDTEVQRQGVRSLAGFLRPAAAGVSPREGWRSGPYVRGAFPRERGYRERGARYV